MIKAHGNSKQGRPYYRTSPSTMTMIKEESKVSGPKDTIATVYDSQDGMVHAKSRGELPRNRMQVSNAKRNNFTSLSLCSNKSLKDPLFVVMEQCKLQDDKFVRTVTVCPEPMCLLASDQQLDDLVRFCTDSKQFSVISIDPNISMGDFSVTCITYRNLLVKDTRTGQLPIMLGPVFVHQSKSYEIYNFFASALIGIKQELSRILAYGTDGEAALVNPFKQQFCFAIHLRCFRHMRQDIQRKLNEMGFSANVVAEILSHIFCVKSGPTFFEGLVDCQSESEFEDKLELVETKWNQYETSRRAHEKLSFLIGSNSIIQRK